MFFIFTPIQEDFQFDQYFLIGLKPPTRIRISRRAAARVIFCWMMLDAILERRNDCADLLMPKNPPKNGLV